jgi:hypothetical protein
VYLLPEHGSFPIHRHWILSGQELRYVEIGGVKCGVILSAYYFTSLVNHLPKVVEHLSNKQPYRCDEETFRIRLQGGKRRVTIQCEGLRISIGVNDVNFLSSNSTILLYQLHQMYSLMLENVPIAVLLFVHETQSLIMYCMMYCVMNSIHRLYLYQNKTYVCLIMCLIPSRMYNPRS